MAEKKFTARKSAARACRRDGNEPAADAGLLAMRLSSALALVETVGFALKEFEEQPGLGSICMALDQAISAVGSAHAEVEEFVESLRQ
jgi:hypothetical protein